MRLYLFMLLLSFSILGKTQMPSLPYSWQEPFMNGFINYTLYEDGTLTSLMCTPCFLCNTHGICSVCQGTGGQFWYGMGIRPCLRCGGSGRCQSCHGKGYTVMNTTTKYGVTIGFDESGNVYYGGSVGSSRSSGRSNGQKIEVKEYLPTFGIESNEKVYCPQCDKVDHRHVHVLK